MTPEQALSAGITDLGIQVDGKAQPTLLEYLALLEKWNRTHNLTAIRGMDRMVSHHLLDSLAVLPHLFQGSKQRLIDIGSGGGLPGIPIAIVRADWDVTLLDSSHKKTAFLRQATIDLDLPNVRVVNARVEEYHPDQRFELVLSRAFSDLSTFATSGRRLLERGGWLVAMKGAYPHAEIDQIPSGLRIVDVPVLRIPGLDAQRHLVILEDAAA